MGLWGKKIWWCEISFVVGGLCLNVLVYGMDMSATAVCQRREVTNMGRLERRGCLTPRRSICCCTT